jgi:hypothetical protein
MINVQGPEEIIDPAVDSIPPVSDSWFSTTPEHRARMGHQVVQTGLVSVDVCDGNRSLWGENGDQ